MKRRRVKSKKISILTDFFIALIIVLIMFSVTAIIKPQDGEQTNYVKPNDVFNKTDRKRKNQNKAIANQILEKYKIEVEYGKETESNIKSLDATPLLDDEIIYRNIIKLNETLEKYPEGFFNEFKNESNNYSVSIYLVDKFSSQNVALATRNTNNEFKIYISNDEEFEKVLHHELYHIIEYFIKLEYDIDTLYVNWNDYNPNSYVYPNSVEDLNDDYIPNVNKAQRVYFVSKYAKTNEKEDRAETFSDMMYKENKPYYFSKEHPIYDKANLIADVLEETFDSVTEEVTERWERFIK